jgi:hypothetical protein
MSRTWPNQPTPGKAGIAFALKNEYYWPGLPDPGRWTTSSVMDKAEAQRILTEQLARFTGRSHAELAPLVAAQRVEAYEVLATSGTTYQVEIQFFWDDRPGDTIRVAGSIDDGGIRAFVPLTDSLLIAPTERLSV